MPRASQAHTATAEMPNDFRGNTLKQCGNKLHHQQRPLFSLLCSTTWSRISRSGGGGFRARYPSPELSCSWRKTQHHLRKVNIEIAIRSPRFSAWVDRAFTRYHILHNRYVVENQVPCTVSTTASIATNNIFRTVHSTLLHNEIHRPQCRKYTCCNLWLMAKHPLGLTQHTQEPTRPSSRISEHSNRHYR